MAYIEGYGDDGWYPDHVEIEELREAITRLRAELSTMTDRATAAEEKQRLSAELNCDLVKQNCKLAERNLALGDTAPPIDWRLTGNPQARTGETGGDDGGSAEEGEKRS